MVERVQKGAKEVSGRRTRWLGGGREKPEVVEGHKVTWRIERWAPLEVPVSCSEERY